MRWLVFTLLLVTATPAVAQPAPPAQQGALAADFDKEGEKIGESCGSLTFKTLGTCPVELATDHPLHLAFGSLAPQNGLGVGGAFLWHATPTTGSWLYRWDADAVATVGGSWRAGVYMKLIGRPTQAPIVVLSPGTSAPSTSGAIHPYPIVNLYSQTTSLQTLYFFGLGPNASPAGQSVFGLTETVVGTNAIIPVTIGAFSRLNLALLGEVNGRFVRVRGNTAESVPSIEQLYDAAGAPGLHDRSGFLQLGEGVRLKPAWLGAGVHTNYLFTVQQFLAGSSTHGSFHRWALDLGHEIPLYANQRSHTASDANGPDECFTSASSSDSCATISRNREGTLDLRLFVTASNPSAGNAVPFYFQPTLGGADVNGNQALASYADYRFRAPNAVLLQESFEHSLGTWPVGILLSADEGNVALAPGHLNLRSLRHSFAVGLTVRAGGFPLVVFSFAFGGTEGHRILATMNASLLGGSARPPT